MFGAVNDCSDFGMLKFEKMRENVLANEISEKIAE